jgi:D-alanyl-D-alanine carboxypeptidase
LSTDRKGVELYQLIHILNIARQNYTIEIYSKIFMKKFLSYFCSLIIVTSIFITLFVHFARNDRAHTQFVSPLPDFMNLTKNNQIKLLDIWLPFIQETEGSEYGVPSLTAKSVLMYDLTTNKTIYEKNAKSRMPMASLTKIMTAIISLENKKNSDQYVVHEENLVGEDSMGLTDGEELSQEELLYGLMMQSGNDAAEVLATNYEKGREAFIKAMNDKAFSLGLIDTRFDNPTGLQGDGVQYTTAYDLLVITKYALDNYPLFRQIVSTQSYIIPATATHREYNLENETNLLSTYEGVKGVKTGYTPEAGLCLVTYLDYGGHKIIGILLNSENRRGEMKELLDYSLRSLGIEASEYQG